MADPSSRSLSSSWELPANEVLPQSDASAENDQHDVQPRLLPAQQYAIGSPMLQNTLALAAVCETCGNGVPAGQRFCCQPCQAAALNPSVDVSQQLAVMQQQMQQQMQHQMQQSMQQQMFQIAQMFHQLPAQDPQRAALMAANVPPTMSVPVPQTPSEASMGGTPQRGRPQAREALPTPSGPAQASGGYAPPRRRRPTNRSLSPAMTAAAEEAPVVPAAEPEAPRRRASSTTPSAVKKAENAPLTGRLSDGVLNMQRSQDVIQNVKYALWSRLTVFKWRQFLVGLRLMEAHLEERLPYRRNPRAEAQATARALTAQWGHLGSAAQYVRGPKGPPLFR